MAKPLSEYTKEELRRVLMAQAATLKRYPHRKEEVLKALKPLFEECRRRMAAEKEGCP